MNGRLTMSQREQLREHEEETTMKRNLLVLAAATAILLWGSTAGAYTTHESWDTTRITMRAGRESFPAGNPYRTSLGTVASRFNQNPSQFQMTQSYDDTDLEFNNEQSEVWFTADSDYDPAVTTWWKNFWTGHVDEADVVFYVGESYTTSMNKTSLWSFGGGSRPFETTALHEYGHVASLGHENDEYNIMGEDWTHIHCNGTTARSYMGEDAADGLVRLYGRRSNGYIEDVSVSIFKYSGEDGEYSEHTLCKMCNSTGTELPSSGFNGQRRYRVTPGQQVRFELTLENNGETTQRGRIGFYVSTDSTVNTSDTRITTKSFSLTRDSVVTQYVTITIPSTLTSGTTYYLGAFIDDNNTVSEVDGNNAAYHIIRVN